MFSMLIVTGTAIVNYNFFYFRLFLVNFTFKFKKTAKIYYYIIPLLTCIGVLVSGVRSLESGVVKKVSMLRWGVTIPW